MENLEKFASLLLDEIGENPKREGLLKTPKRFSESMLFLTQGYHLSLNEETEGSIFTAESKDMVIIKDIEFYSLCEHHLLPFFGICHIGYIPNEKILGFSKFARIIELYSRRLQIQERLTNEVANAIDKVLSPMGVGVIIKARHMCMMMRGVEKQNSEVVTSVMLGSFRDRINTRNEFLNLLG